MPPNPVSIDGVTKQAVPAPPHSVALNEEISKEQQAREAADPKQQVKNQVKSSKIDHGPTIVILLTLVFMVLLIGLAYFAYTKSK